MNYEKIYNDLIKTRKLLERKKRKGFCFEKHHVIPRSCGGTNDKNNLILLTPKEHYIAHLLLIEIYEGELKNKMRCALWWMSKIGGKKITATQYDRIKKELRLSKLGKKLSEETKEKIRIANTGKKQSISTIEKKIKSLTGIKRTGQGFKIWETRKKNNKKLSDESRTNISKAQLGKIMSEETKKKISKKVNGIIRSEETKEKIRKANIGRKHSEETKEKIGKISLGRKHSEETKKKISEIVKKRWNKKYSTETN